MLFKKIILLAVIFMFLAFGLVFSQTDREVIIMVEQGTIILPVGKISAPIDSVTINSDTLNSVLISFNPELILEAFPDFNLADTIAISPFGDTIKTLDLSLVYKIQLPEGTDNQLVANTLDTLPGVIFAQPNGTTYLQSSVEPNDTFFYRQWALKDTGQFGGILHEDIKVTDAWEITTGNPTIKIAIIDGGVNGSHPDLSGKVSGDATYYGGHGTHVAGIASAKSNNQIGISGVDWNAQIIAKDCADRALSEESGNLDDTKIYNGIISSVNEGAAVLNGSFGHLGYKELEREAFAYAYKMNRVSVVGMGNNYLAGNPAVYPAAYGQGIIAVGATTSQGERSYFSCTGPHIDVVAPGGEHLAPNYNEHDIYSCWPTASYIYKGGTSFATPHVTGLASLLKGYRSDLFNDDIEQIIRISADDKGDPGWDPWYGAGRINARRALEYLQFPYSLVHLNIPQGYDYDTVTVYFMRFYDTPGLPQGVQFLHIERHEIRQHVDFIHPFVSPPYGWGRGAATQKGYSAERLNFGMGFCDVVPGSMTTTDCNLYTYTYKNYSDWYPGQPWETNFFYTLLGEYRLDVGATRSAQSVSPYIAVGWNDAYTNEGGYKLERKDATNNQWAIIRTSGPDTTTFQDNNLTGSETYTYKVRGYNGTKYGTYSNEKVIKARPSPPSDFEAMVECVVYRPKGCQTRSNTVFLFWSPPGNQKLPISFYKIKIQEWGGPTTYHGPVYGLEDTLCLSTNKNYYLYVYSVDSEGDSSNYSPAVHVMTGSWDDCSGPLNKPTVQIPQQFYLDQNYPNPFNLSTTIEYGLPQDAHVKLTVYNILGEKVRVLVNEYQSAGERNVIWDGKNDNGDVVASGIYLYRIEAGSFTKTAKMSLLK